MSMFSKGVGGLVKGRLFDRFGSAFSGRQTTMGDLPNQDLMHRPMNPARNGLEEYEKNPNMIPMQPRPMNPARSGLEGFMNNPGMMHDPVNARPMNPARDGLEGFRSNPDMMNRLSGNVKPNMTGGMDYGSMFSGNANIGRQVGKASTYGVPGSTGNAVSGMSMSKLGGMAKNFGRSIMPGSGRTVAQSFGKQSLGKKAGGFLSKAGALPGWSMPAAAAIGWQVNKRAGQKAHQKDLTAYHDKVRNTPTDMQHTIGPKPEHNRQAGFLGRMFKR
jgi:hypothetical protein